ncbi:MAG: methyltransferase domain-containing protein [Lentisphaerae bacterium]|jgi:tRNA (guanine-N7-)-methyltransferase|nr:methyltransferase domain-containing protein [Lentisphaerota bacterium]
MQILTNTFFIFPLPLAFPEQYVELDMGCGKGSFTLALAQRYPERLVLASDVMLGRLKLLEKKKLRRKLDNLELLRASNLALASFQLPPRSIDRIHLLCPDPWPKRHHRVKRLVCTDFVTRLTRILKPDGIVHLATDHAPYFDNWLEIFAHFPAFRPDPAAIADIADLKTDFELQWTAQGIPVRHLAYRLQE